MASENTHIYLADRIRRNIHDEPVTKIISDHMDEYFIGSIFTDILFYSKDKQAAAVASRLHGEDGQPTNQIVFDLLDSARSEKDHRNFAFVAGLLTHYAVDITLHPIVFYFSGDDPDAKCIDDDKSAYRHMHYETSIDFQLNDSFYLDEIIQPMALNRLKIYSLLDIEQVVVEKALRRQIKYYRLTRKRVYFILFRALSRLGLFPARAIAGFHANLDKDSVRLPDPIHYKDVVTGEPKTATLNGLVDMAVQFGCHMVETAYAYYTLQIDLEDGKKVIAGQSLETGQTGTMVKDIRFYADVD